MLHCQDTGNPPCSHPMPSLCQPHATQTRKPTTTVFALNLGIFSLTCSTTFIRITSKQTFAYKFVSDASNKKLIASGMDGYLVKSEVIAIFRGFGLLFLIVEKVHKSRHARARTEIRRSMAAMSLCNSYSNFVSAILKFLYYKLQSNP